MVFLIRHLSSVMLSVLLFGGNALLCAGWAPTPEARMECCDGTVPCPMHAGGEDSPRSTHDMTQAQADACCASSEPDSSSQPSPAPLAITLIAVIGTGVLPPAAVPAVIHHEAVLTPVPIAAVPKHVLFSVFLV